MKYFLPANVKRQNDGDLHLVGWDEGWQPSNSHEGSTKKEHLSIVHQGPFLLPLSKNTPSQLLVSNARHLLSSAVLQMQRMSSQQHGTRWLNYFTIFDHLQQ